MKKIIRNITFCFSLLLLLSCNQERRTSTAMGAARMLEANFKGKDIAVEKINKVVKDYLLSINTDSLSFDDRYSLFSQKYIAKVKSLINHAKNSDQKTVERLMMAEQVHVFSFRKSFTYDQLNTLRVKEVLAIQDETNIPFGFSDAEFKNLLFYDANQASGAIKSVFSISPVLFDRELDEWKIDLFGDPIHQKMKEQKLASLQSKSYDEYKKSFHEILDVTEESWVPLRDR